MSHRALFLVLASFAGCTCGKPKDEPPKKSSEQPITLPTSATSVESTPGAAKGAKLGASSGMTTCIGGQTCTWTCPSGGCVQICANNSNCTAHCEGGGCKQTCASGANCQLDCEGGNCRQSCSGVSCQKRCGDAGGCS